MITIDVNPEDLRILHLRLEKLGRQDVFRDVLGAIGDRIRTRTREYPPPSIANSPDNPSGHWYVRGYGTMYASGVGYRTSQDLKSKWYTRLFPTYVEVGNTATYAPFVHGPDQVPIHKQRGWKSLLEETTRIVPELLRKMAEHIEKIWGGDA